MINFFDNLDHDAHPQDDIIEIDDSGSDSDIEEVEQIDTCYIDVRARIRA